MPRADRGAVRFVRSLLSGGIAEADGAGRYVVAGSGEALDTDLLRGLERAGVLECRDGICRAKPEARSWVRRQMIEEDAFAAQHRVDVRRADGIVINMGESPLARLGTSTDGRPAFLAPHHVEAGERVRRLAERAQLQPRVTMSYSAAHTAGGKGVSRASDISDMASDARRALADIHRVLPSDCAGVVLDVCGLLKGLQVVEMERGWPRRSAKLVLRIGLEQLAQHYGLAPVAVGPESRKRHAWLGEGARPEVLE